MGLFLGAGAALMALWLVLRLASSAFGLTLWIGKTAFTAVTATVVLYLVTKEAP